MTKGGFPNLTGDTGSKFNTLISGMKSSELYSDKDQKEYTTDLFWVYNMCNLKRLHGADNESVSSCTCVMRARHTCARAHAYTAF